MPLYEYLCKKCGHRFERIQKFSARIVKKCPECGGAVEQVITAPAVQFKGSGWYVNDYPKKSSGSSGKSQEKDSGGDSASSDSTKSDAGENKSESKAESKSESKNESKNESKKEGSSKKPAAKK
jgi:putative FmdB family regulatory protein